jgi:ABC-type multidrug transport system fused ATPase/permease subunit
LLCVFNPRAEVPDVFVQFCKRRGHFFIKIQSKPNDDRFIAIMTILGAFGVMLFINWQLALLTFIIMPVVIWLAYGRFLRYTSNHW